MKNIHYIRYSIDTGEWRHTFRRERLASGQGLHSACEYECELKKAGIACKFVFVD